MKSLNLTMKTAAVLISFLFIAIILPGCGGKDEKEAESKYKSPPKEEDLDFGDDILGDLDLEYDTAEASSWRTEKDNYLKSGKDSPIPSSVRKGFKGLTYYPISDAYAVKAILNKFEGKDSVQLTTSKGSKRTMIKYGRFDFNINGNTYSLIAYVPADNEEGAKQLFVPFTDKTNSIETYKNGRYMDIDLNDGDNYVLDFNKAYSPYCAYSDKYSCPIPPKENRLNIEIKAGEKNFAVK